MIESQQDRRRRLATAEWWTLTDAAFMLDVAKSTITRWIANGLSSEAGIDDRGQKRVRVRRRDVHAWKSDPTRRTRRKLPPSR